MTDSSKQDAEISDTESECSKLRKLAESYRNVAARMANHLRVNGFNEESSSSLRHFVELEKKANENTDTYDGITLDQWYSGFSSIHSTEESEDINKLAQLANDVIKLNRRDVGV